MVVVLVLVEGAPAGEVAEMRRRWKLPQPGFQGRCRARSREIRPNSAAAVVPAAVYVPDEAP